MRNGRQFALFFLEIVCLFALAFVGSIYGQDGSGSLQAYSGDSVQGVDTTTLNAKLMCGYQAWFTAPGDGSGRGWSHYDRRGKFEPGSCCIDLWPDTSELEESEKYATPFNNSDGSAALVFSSHNRQTVLRHFRWMKEYGIDGVFVQRFAVETFAELNLRHANTVLMNCRDAANLNGRAYAVMYDLSGLHAGQMQRVIDDWKLLVDPRGSEMIRTTWRTYTIVASRSSPCGVSDSTTVANTVWPSAKRCFDF